MLSKTYYAQNYAGIIGLAYCQNNPVTLYLKTNYRFYMAMKRVICSIIIIQMFAQCWNNKFMPYNYAKIIPA